MSKKIKIFIIAGLFMMCSNIVFAVQTGGVQYNMPINYSLIDEKSLNQESEQLFKVYMNSEDERQKQILLNRMLSNYSILAEIDQENPLYFVRLGIIYDKMGKDKWAKSNFFRSSNLAGNYPYAFYSFGNFYFDRYEYRKALKAYKKAYDNGYDKDFDTLYQMGRIYEKFGDFSESIKFYKKALVYKNSAELRSKINMLESLIESNSLYNQRKRVNVE